MALQRIAYFNASEEAIPPHSFIQFTGTPVVTATGDYVMNAVKPGDGTGPYFIDDGQGATATGDGRYSNCFVAGEGLVWLAWQSEASSSSSSSSIVTPPSAAWIEIGPTTRTFFADSTGVGYLYAGQFDSTYNRVLAIQKPVSSLPGGGGSGGGCGCCNCMDCLNDAQAIETSCGSCADNAAAYYTFNPGNWTAYPSLGGNQSVFHVSSCTWESKDDITVTLSSSSSSSGSGTYKWVAVLSTQVVYLVNTGGTDVLDLGSHPVTYTAIAEEFNCRCQSRFHATDAYKFPSPTGLLCDICLEPHYDQYACADITPAFITDNPTMKLKIISSFWGTSVCGSSTITLNWSSGTQQWTSGTITCDGTSWIFTCGCGAATGTWAGGWFVRVQFTNGTGTCDYRTYWVSGLRPSAPAITAIQGGSYELKTSGGCGAPAGTDIIMKLTWP